MMPFDNILLNKDKFMPTRQQMEEDDHLVIFNNHQIRRVLHENFWWFVVLDIVAMLTAEISKATFTDKN
jgi:prophage antirepressor-like protein